MFNIILQPLLFMVSYNLKTVFTRFSWGYCLPLFLFSSMTWANNWYEQYDLKKVTQDSSIFNSQISFYISPDRADKPSITLVHGVGGSAQDFATIITALAQNYQLIIPDLPGYGASETADTTYSPQNYADALIEILPHLVKKNNIVIGHSMGGNISLQLALKSPPLADKLILIDAAGFLNKFSFSEHLATNYVSNNVAIINQHMPALKNVLSKINSMLPDPSSILLSKPSRKHLLDDNTSIISAISLMDENLTELIRQPAPPTYIIWGGKDQAMPVQVSSMLSYLLKTHAVFIFPEAGHSPQKEHPEEVATQIITFIEQGHSSPAPIINQVNQDISINCSNQDDSKLLNNARYHQVTLTNCKTIEISHLQAKQVILNNSAIVFHHLTINANEGFALKLHGSNLEILGGEIHAATIAEINKSSLELNAMDIYVSEGLIESTLPVMINASLTKVYFKDSTLQWHGKIKIP